MNEVIPAESIRSSKEIAAALAKAQKSFGPITRSKKVRVKMKSGGEYEFKYAPFEEIVDAIRDALADNSIAIIQSIDRREDSHSYVITTLLHSSGEYLISGGTPVLFSEDGAQAYGSALTYAKRYDLSLFLCLASEDDDDGNAGSGNQTTVIAEKHKVDENPDKVFLAKLELAASFGTGPLTEAWKDATAAQRKSCMQKFGILKEVAAKVDKEQAGK